MLKSLVASLVLTTLFLANCSLPGNENAPEGGTLTPTVVIELPTPTNQTLPTLAVNATHTPNLPETITPTETPSAPIEPLPTVFPQIWYVIQPGTPLAINNTPHEAAGCAWLGVGGQVFGVDTAPILGLSILVGGTLNGNYVGSLGTTGMETNIGEGGYEVTLADHPVESSGTVWIQIVDSIGNPLSEKIYFDTFNDCNRNFILVNFLDHQAQSPTGVSWPAYLPLITNPSSSENRLTP